MKNPYSCLYSYSVPPNTLLLSPTTPPAEPTEWIALATLLKLHRTSPAATVLSLWHNKYNVDTWFSSHALDCIYQYNTPRGASLTIGLNFIQSLLAPAKPSLASSLILSPYSRFALTLGLLTTLSYLLKIEPLIKTFVIRLQTTELFWRTHQYWSRIVFAPLPLKIYLGQLVVGAWGGVEKKVGKIVWEYLVELETMEIEKGVRQELRGAGGVKGEEERKEQEGAEGSEENESSEE